LDAGSELVHGTCVALGRRAALLRGASGCGKSDLALRFLFLARRGPAAQEPPRLVADDQVRLRRDDARLYARAPENLFGKLEVRGVGIVGVKALQEAELVLVADLVEPQRLERLPERAETVRLLGIDVPLIQLAPLEVSAAMKLVLALSSSPLS
jgi:HPr kinase/phosphorylase